MNNENIITNATSSLQTNQIVNKQTKKEKKKKYNQTWYQKNKEKIKMINIMKLVAKFFILTKY
ncbi:hypothetical protein [Spiroplasma ixodetis]|uniref:hypothetical protein n=1 Tax=Spiroplasma ixodetis TaxID=2141 RepID=UPI002577DF2C|nr:hypothetical protein [Spiroplasma ixodetis]WJG69546.1 hypothetical protein SIXOD_v1c04220 [Spiroplasma ixodetis Y32]